MMSASAGRSPLRRASAVSLSRMLRVEGPCSFCLQKLRQSYSFGSINSVLALATTGSSSLRNSPSVDAVRSRTEKSLTYRVNFLVGKRRMVLISSRELVQSILIASSIPSMMSVSSRIDGPSKSLLTMISTLSMSLHTLPVYGSRDPVHNAADADIRRVLTRGCTHQDMQGFKKLALGSKDDRVLEHRVVSVDRREAVLSDQVPRGVMQGRHTP